MFYLIGQYDDGLNAILDSYETVEMARRSIRWQALSGGLDWHDSNKTRATTWGFFSGNAHSTEWVICVPSNLKGVFLPLDGGEPIETSRGYYTKEAYREILDRAVSQHVESLQ